MNDVDNILKEAGAGGLNNLLQPTAAVPDVYRKTQDARFQSFDALIAPLRGPQPEEMRPAVTAPQPMFHKAPAGLDLRSASPPQPLGIAAPAALPATMPGRDQPAAAEPPLQVKRLERPR